MNPKNPRDGWKVFQAFGTWASAIGTIAMFIFTISHFQKNDEQISGNEQNIIRTNQRVVSDTTNPTSSEARIILTFPNIKGDVSWNDKVIQEWLKVSKQSYEGNHSTRYKIQGTIKNSKSGAKLLIDIKTNVWWPQGGSIEIMQNGKWEGDIYLDDSLPPMRLRITLQEGETKTIQEFNFKY